MEGTKTPVMCKAHITEGMVNVVSKMCGQDGCNKRPSYGMEGTNTRIMCATHAGDDMVSMQKRKEKGSGKQGPLKCIVGQGWQDAIQRLETG